MFLHEVNRDVEDLVFKFFYKYSRFEYSLKANGYCKAKGPVCRAEADWIAFREQYENDYITSDAANDLLHSPPKLQVYRDGILGFADAESFRTDTDLLKVIRAIKRIRNNLFHGGKHGAGDEGGVARNTYLLTIGCVILDELSAINADVEFDYPGIY